MPDTPTPGQVAHAAFVTSLDVAAQWVPTFATLSPTYQRAWEAAAQAVLDAWQAQPRLEEAPCPTNRASDYCSGSKQPSG